MSLNRSRIEEIYRAATGLTVSGREMLLADTEPEVRREVELMLSRDSSLPLTVTFQARHGSTRAPGELLGPYLIEAPIGHGGMGQVFLATDTRLKRKVAIKLLRQEESLSPDIRGRFLREARAASALTHPNIVVLHDISHHEGIEFLVMEYVLGKTLKDLIPADGLPFHLVCLFGSQIALALDAAHAAGIVHRDIKPGNIMITGEDRVKVLDFGIAKVAAGEDAPDRTVAGTVIGTVSYMSPEQSRGEDVDGRSDIFSLGCVLYQAATGRLPFTGSNALAVMHEIATAEPKPPSAHNSTIRAGFDDLIGQCLAKNPNQRIASAGVLAQELRSLAAQGHPSQYAVTDSHPDERNFAPLPRSRARLPEPITRLFGRDTEMGRITTLLLQDGVRLVNLTGPAGIGKTRLAIELLNQIAGEFDFAFYVGLEDVRDAQLVPSTILRGLGLQEEDPRPQQTCIVECLRRGRSLLVLDNFEHVSEAAGELSALLAHCRQLKILITSRSLLHLQGEREYPVRPLVVSGGQTSVHELLAQPAVALFLDRAPAEKLTLAMAQDIAEICTRLDGLPLAIELAAARSKLLSPRDILGRLRNRFQLLGGGPRDLPARQQTLRQAIDWSYELLGPTEQILLKRLAVFAGGATVPSVEMICGEPDSDTLDLLTSLADKSLVVQQRDDNGNVRIRMLETIRAYTLEQWASMSATEILNRHSQHYLSLVLQARAFGDCDSESDAGNYDSVEADYGNCRAALHRFLTQKEFDAALEMAAGLWPFWEARGYWTEGREQLKGVLVATRGIRPPIRRAKALYAAGVLADAQGDYSAAKAAFEEHLALQRTAGDQGALAAAINNLGIVALRNGDYEAARRAYHEALGILRALNSQRGIAQCLNNLGHVALGEADHETARIHYLESLAISREIRSSRDVAWTLSNLGDLARAQSEWAEAQALYSQSFALFREINDRLGLASCMSDLGNLAALNRQYANGAQLYQESLVIFGELGDKRGIARVLEGFAALASDRGYAEVALRLAGAAMAIHDNLGVKHWKPQWPDSNVKSARDTLGAQAESLLAEGKQMPLERAIEYALGNAAL